MTDTDSSSSSSSSSPPPARDSSVGGAGGDDGPRSDGEPPSLGALRCQLEIQNPCRYADVGARALRPLVERMLAELAPGARSFTLRFVSDREMRRLNADYRHKDRPTDVLSFPGDFADDGDVGWPLGHVERDPFETGPFEIGHVGDVAVSVPTARRQAAERGHATGRELRLLVLHGLLHCLGHDHEQDEGEMAALESRLRRRFLPETAGR